MARDIDKWLKPAGAVFVTVITSVILIWWLVIVGGRIGKVPTVDAQGNVILDEWQRAKDVLLIVAPLFTAAMGYWLGSKESATAAEDAQNAEERAKEAQAKTDEVTALAIQLAGSLDQPAYEQVRSQNPAFFGN